MAPPSMAQQMRELRLRADEDFVAPADIKQAGRHRAEIVELGLRVSLTRSRYPNRPGGVDQYAVTISRRALDHLPALPEVGAVLHAAFGDVVAAQAVERPAGPLVRMYRVPAEGNVPAQSA